jgi:hypothetical protein
MVDKVSELREVTNFVNGLTTLCFTANSAVRAWEFVYDLSAVGSSYQLHSQLLFVSSVMRNGAVRFRASNMYFCATPT